MKLSALPSFPHHLLKNGLLLLGITIGLGCNLPAASAFSLISRSTNLNIAFTEPTFSDANAAYLAMANVQTDPQDQLNLRIELPAYAQNYAFGTSSNLTIATTSPNPAAYDYQLKSTGGVGMFGWRYTTPIATAPNGDFLDSLIVRSNNGNWDLVFVDSEYTSGSLQTTSDFELGILISGNWSSLGPGAHQTELLGLHPGYTIVDNFVYDPNRNQTRFRAVSNNWDGSPAAGLSFVLHGSGQAAAVPEPTTVAGVLLGGLGLSAFRRRKTSQRRKIG